MPQGAVKMPIFGETRTPGVLDTPKSSKMLQKIIKLAVARLELQKNGCKAKVLLLSYATNTSIDDINTNKSNAIKHPTNDRQIK